MRVRRLAILLQPILTLEHYDRQRKERMPTDHDLYLALRDKWVHEDDLLDQRISWLLLSQTLLFAAYGVFMQVTKDSPYARKAGQLLMWIPWFGIALICNIFIAIIAAISAQYQVNTEGSRQGYKVNVGGGLTWLGYIPPIALPVLFIVAWLIAIAV